MQTEKSSVSLKCYILLLERFQYSSGKLYDKSVQTRKFEYKARNIHDVDCEILKLDSS